MVNCLTGIMRYKTGVMRMAGGGGKWQRHGQTQAARGKKKWLIGGVHMSVKGKRENDLGEGCNLVEKAHSVNDGKGARVDWASEGGSGLWRESRPVRKLGQLGRIPGKIQMRI
jgi:hypothetical protein